jgi:hypothetical protein
MFLKLWQGWTNTIQAFTTSSQFTVKKSLHVPHLYSVLKAPIFSNHTNLRNKKKKKKKMWTKDPRKGTLVSKRWI